MEDYSKRLDNDNLICLCSYHHRLAEDGIITKDELQEIIKGKEQSPPRVASQKYSFFIHPQLTYIHTK